MRFTARRSGRFSEMVAAFFGLIHENVPLVHVECGSDAVAENYARRLIESATAAGYKLLRRKGPYTIEVHDTEFRFHFPRLAVDLRRIRG